MIYFRRKKDVFIFLPINGEISLSNKFYRFWSYNLFHTDRFCS